jgi:hypothetical protein
MPVINVSAKIAWREMTQSLKLIFLGCWRAEMAKASHRCSSAAGLVGMKILWPSVLIIENGRIENQWRSCVKTSV